MDEMKTSLPNLFIPGAGKSGTSALHEYLDQHPDITMSKVKEPHFWTPLDFKAYTRSDWDKYLSLFESDPITRYRGESSTGYMQFPFFIERIKQYYDETPRFIFILRNPIDRCYSHYWWLRGMGSEKLSFRDAVMADYDLEPGPETKLPEANYKSYFQFGLYGKWLSRFFDNFHKDCIHIVSNEELKVDPLATVNECFDFLGLEKLDAITEVEVNKTQILRNPGLFKYSKLLAFNQLNIPRIVKDVTPGFIKKAIRKHLIKSVLRASTTDKSYPKISDEDREWLKVHYEADVRLLKSLTEMRFESWTDFKDL